MRHSIRHRFSTCLIFSLVAQHGFAFPEENRIFHQTLDSISEIQAAGGEVSATNVIEQDGGIKVSDGGYVKFPAPESLNINEGTIEFRVKPDWDGATVDGPRYFLQLGENRTSSNGQYPSVTFRLGVWHKDGENYLDFRHDGTFCAEKNSCQRSVSTHSSEPNEVMAWKSGEWHDIKVFWSFTEQEQYIALVVDNDFSAENIKVLQLDDFTVDNIWIGSVANGVYASESVIDDLSIYNKAAIDLQDPVASYTDYVNGNGVQEPHETIYNSADAVPVDTSVLNGQDLVFYQKPAFVPTFEGENPAAEQIVASLNHNMFIDESDSIFVNVFSNIDSGNTQINLSALTDPATGVVLNADIRVVKNWWQAGDTTFVHKSVFPVYTPELLLYDDSMVLEGEWSPANLPVYDILDHVQTHFQRNISRQLVITATTTKSTPAGSYQGEIALTTDAGQVFTLPVTVTVDPVTLEQADRDLMVYLRGRYEPSQADSNSFISESRFDSQLANLKSHGFNGVSLYGATIEYAEKAKQAGLERQVVYHSSYTDDLKNALANNGYLPLFYGQDEPNYESSTRIPAHLAKAKTIHDGGGLVTTAISKELADAFNDENSDLYTQYPDWGYQPLDLPNISIRDKASKAYFEDLLNGRTDKATNNSGQAKGERETYYWQMSAEDPRVNRYYAGIHLWLTGMDGIFPYVYQDVRNNPYDDFDVWSETKSIYRDHLVTYPSENGPIDTIQWEALREGLDDFRILQTWQTLNSEVNTFDAAAAQSSVDVINGAVAKYRYVDGYSNVTIEDFENDRVVYKEQLLAMNALLDSRMQDDDHDAVPNGSDTSPNNIFIPSAVGISVALSNRPEYSLQSSATVRVGESLDLYAWNSSAIFGGDANLDILSEDRQTVYYSMPNELTQIEPNWIAGKNNFILPPSAQGDIIIRVTRLWGTQLLGELHLHVE